MTASKEYSGELGSRLLLNNDNEDDPDSSNVLKDLFNYIGFE